MCNIYLSTVDSDITGLVFNTFGNGSQKGNLVSEINLALYRLNITISSDDMYITISCTLARHGAGNRFICVMCLSDLGNKISCVE